MDVFDRVRLGQDQQVIVALLMAGAAEETLAAKIVFRQTETLDLGAHGPVKDQDTFAGRLLQRLQDLRAVTVCALAAEQLIEHLRTLLLRMRHEPNHIKTSLCQHAIRLCATSVNRWQAHR